MVMPSTTARHIIMTDEETENILQSAQDCVNSECSIDEVDDLLQVLKSTEKDLEDRLEKIMNLVGQLQHINQKEERQTDEVRQFVKDMLRVFSHDVSIAVVTDFRPKSPFDGIIAHTWFFLLFQQKPLVFPAGFSGDISKKSLTAYDALPPKPWKPSAP
jgi:hypothetical protein